MTNDKTPKTPKTPESTPNTGIQDFVLNQTAPPEKANIINNSQSGASVDARSILGLSPETNAPIGLDATNKLTTPSLRRSTKSAEQTIAPKSGGVSGAFGDERPIDATKAGSNDFANVGRQLPSPGKTTDLPANTSPSSRMQDVGRLTPPAEQSIAPVNRAAEAPQSWGTTIDARAGIPLKSNDLSGTNQTITNPVKSEQVSVSGAPQNNSGQQSSFDQYAGRRSSGDNATGITSDVRGLTTGPTDQLKPQSVAATTLVTGPFEMRANSDGQVKISKPAADAPPNDVSRYPIATSDNSAEKGTVQRGTQQEFLGQPKPNSTTEATLARTSISGEPVTPNHTRSVSSDRLDTTANPLKTNSAGAFDNSNLARQNSESSSETQNQSKLAGGSFDASGRPNPQGVSLDSQGRQNLPASSPDVQGRQNLPTGALDSQGKQTAAGATNDALGQTRRETGLQLPETKQSSGRTDTGGISNSDPTRQNTGRNDANTAKVPDAKTLAGLDQKFGDKLNPPAGGRGDIPIVMPGAPDILGGLRGIGQKADAKDGKEVKGEVKDGKDAKVDPKSPSGETKGETKAGVTSADDKMAAQKGIRPDAENATKATDAKPSPDGRPNNPDGKQGQDGRTAEGKQQGGSNLVHDGGTTSGNAQSGGKSEGAAGGKSEGAAGTKSEGGADKVGEGKGSGDGKTRIEPTGVRVVDADGKLIGGRPEQSNTGRTDIADKTNIDSAGKSTAQPGSRSEGPFVLPPGSLPVPDLVGGIRNIGQQIDARTGKPVQADAANQGVGKQPDKGDAVKGDAIRGDAGKGDAIKGDGTKGDGTKGDASKIDPKTPFDGVKTVVTGGVRTGDVKPGDAKPVDSKLIDGIAAAITGAVRIGDVRTGADKPIDSKTGDGVKTVVTGGANTGDAIAQSGGVKAGDSAKIPGTIGANLGDGVKTAVTGGATAGDGKGADGKPITPRNPLTDKLDAAIVVPPSVVPLNQMIGNLKAIAERIFPPESRGTKSDVFDNFLPGRKTEKIEGDRTQSPTSASVRPEATIPIIRSIDGQISRGDEQFVIKLPQDKGSAQAKPDKTSSVTGDASSDKVSAKGGDLTALSARTKTDAIAGETKSDASPPWEMKVDKALPARDAKAGAEEEEVFPLAAIEYFGRDFEKTISEEDEVSFDGEAIAAPDEDNRYQYVVEAGDTIELIAIKTLNNVALAPLIYDINKDAIPIGMQDGRMVFTMKPGTTIWLPFPKEVKAYLNNLGGQMPNS